MLYRRLRAQTDELNRMAAVQTDFLRGITHDLQTPLTSIRALASELQQGDQVDTAARIDLETIAQQADRLRRMVGQLLAVSRLEFGALTPRQEVFRVEPLVQRTWDALRASEHPFTLTSEGPPHLVAADPDRVEQVLWALLDNAVKYSPSGAEVNVRVSARPATDGQGLLSEVAIRDSVWHVGRHAQPAAESSSSAPTSASPGPRREWHRPLRRGCLVEAMDGSLRIDSQPGAGTTVTITLPAEPAAETFPESEPGS